MTHCSKFIIRALDFRIAVAHVLAESLPFCLKSACLLLKGLKCAAQLPGSCLRIRQDLSGFDFIGPSLFELLPCLALSLAASLQV